MSITCKLDYTAFRRGLDAKLRVSKRDEADILNRAGRDVCLKSIKYMPRADAAEISAALKSNGLVFKLLQSPNFQHRLPRKLAGKAFAKRSRAELIADAKTLIASRRRSRAYIAAGWIKAAQTFGAAKNRKVSDRGEAGKGYGKRATAGNLAAMGANLATGAIKVGPPSLQQSLDEVGNDMKAYGERKLAGNWNRR